MRHYSGPSKRLMAFLEVIESNEMQSQINTNASVEYSIKTKPVVRTLHTLPKVFISRDGS